MSSRRSRFVLILLSLFLWAHLIPAIIDLPWLYPERYQIKETFSFSTKLYGSELEPSLTIGEFESKVIEETVANWTMVSILFVLGIYSCWKIGSNSKRWPYWVLFLSGFVCFLTVPSLIELLFSYSSVSHHLNWLFSYLANKSYSTEEFFRTYFMLMNIYISPILFSGLFMFSFFELISRVRNRDLEA